MPGYGWVLAEPTVEIPEKLKKYTDLILQDYFAKQNTPEHIVTQYNKNSTTKSEHLYSLKGQGVNNINKSYKVLLLKVNELKDAEDAVIKAEESKLQADVNAAKELVNKLKDSETKTSLTNRLNEVQQAIDQAKADEQANKEEYQALVTKSTDAVAKAEKSKDQADVNAAKELVNKLKDTETKVNLTNRLNEVQQAIDQAKTDEINPNVPKEDNHSSSSSNNSSSNTNRGSSSKKEVNVIIREMNILGHEEITDVDKTWKIHFNKELDKEFIKDHLIFIMDDNKYKVNTKLSCYGNDVFVTPEHSLERNREYYIIIRKISAKDGSQLNKESVFIFNIA